MSRKDSNKKKIELAYLTSVQDMGSLIPDGMFCIDEKPDFKLKTPTGFIGIELVELLRPAPDGQIPPVHAEAQHKSIVLNAKRLYCQDSHARPVSVFVYFDSINGKVDQAAQNLVKIIRDNTHFENTPVNHVKNTWPVSAMSIALGEGDWTNGESGSATLDDIINQIHVVLERKETKLSSYKKNLPGAPLWLLLYSGISVSRALPIPPSLCVDLSIKSSFDKVFWYSDLDKELIRLLG